MQESVDYGCDRKQVYPLHKARKIAQKMRRDTEETIEYYHCNRHHGWHIANVFKVKK
ncbi:MAG TPA: hypothetical protein VN622_09000 [Clostridia bacterium]|nr:hypothetical protein [Clostridia bacterium]